MSITPNRLTHFLRFWLFFTSNVVRNLREALTDTGNTKLCEKALFIFWPKNKEQSNGDI